MPLKTAILATIKILSDEVNSKEDHQDDVGKEDQILFELVPQISFRPRTN